MQQVTTQNTSWKYNKCEYVMLHHSGNDDFHWTISYFQKTSSGVSAHYIVSKMGKIYKFNTEKDVLRHAGNGEYDGITNNMNYYAIGIEVISNGYQFSVEQKEAVKNLITWIINKRGILASNIIRHKDYSPDKWDIGDNFRNEDFYSFEEYKSHTFGTYYKDTLKEAIKYTDSALWNYIHLYQQFNESGEINMAIEQLKDSLENMNNKIEK